MLVSETHSLLLSFFFRISGNAASNKNIHGTVSEQLKKNFAKSRWKVVLYPTTYTVYIQVCTAVNEVGACTQVMANIGIYCFSQGGRTVWLQEI